VTSDVVYVGGIYEKDTISGQVTKYYYTAARRATL
jgi:hypothetical protein